MLTLFRNVTKLQGCLLNIQITRVSCRYSVDTVARGSQVEFVSIASVYLSKLTLILRHCLLKSHQYLGLFKKMLGPEITRLCWQDERFTLFA